MTTLPSLVWVQAFDWPLCPCVSRVRVLRPEDDSALLVTDLPVCTGAPPPQVSAAQAPSREVRRIKALCIELA